MKKTIFILAFVATMVACNGNSTTKTTETVDSIEVVDSITTDSVEVTDSIL